MVAKPFFYLLNAAVIGRFWQLVDERGADECWPWRGEIKNSASPYGRFTISGSRLAAHRVSLAIALGRDIGSDLLACHHCDNPRCVNPDHLFEGSPSDNARDSAAKGRHRCHRGYTFGGTGFPGVALRGSAHPLATIDEQTALWIVRDTRGHKRLARESGIPLGTVKNVRQGRCWNHVTGIPLRAVR